MIRRIFVEKKKPFAVAAKELKEEMEKYLGIRRWRNIWALSQRQDRI